MNAPIHSLLVVDDSVPELQVMVAFLKERYQVSVTTDGHRALEMLNSHKPNLVLLDVNMPGMDGYEVCRKIRQKDKVLKIIFVSANDSTEEILKGYAVGGNDYVVKPFSPDILLSKINQSIRADYEIEQMSHESSGLAMEAMTSLGELGAVLTFLRSSFRATNIDMLYALVARFMESYGLIYCIQLRTQLHSQNYTNQAELTPIESELLSRIAKMSGRFAESGERMFINYEHASLIIKNMPKSDEFKMGRLRDNLAIMLEGTDEKLALLSFEEDIGVALDIIQSEQEKAEPGNFVILEHSLQKIESELWGAAMDEGQKNHLISTVKDSQKALHDKEDSARRVEEQISDIQRRIRARALQEPVKQQSSGSFDFL